MDSLLTASCALQLVAKQQCLTAEGQRVGRLTVLPIMLSAVLPYAQSEGSALQHFLHSLATNGACGDAGAMWVVQHIQVPASLLFLNLSTEGCLLQKHLLWICRPLTFLLVLSLVLVRYTAILCVHDGAVMWYIP